MVVDQALLGQMLRNQRVQIPVVVAAVVGTTTLLRQLVQVDPVAQASSSFDTCSKFLQQTVR